MLTFPVAYGRDNVTKTVKRMTSARRLVFTDDVLYRFSQALKRSSHFFFPHVPRAQRLAPARTKTRVVRLGAQCTDHCTTGQSRGVGKPVVRLTTHVKSSTLYGRSYGRKSKFFRLDGLLLPFCIIMGLRSASSAIMWRRTGNVG